jgi:hypothetical protein
MLPNKNYPPASLAKMIKECGAIGRPDLGQQIMAQWNRVCEKYPVVFKSWGAAQNIGSSSVKKNVFGGSEFSEWLGQAQVIKMPVRKNTTPRKTTKKAA